MDIEEVEMDLDDASPKESEDLVIPKLPQGPVKIVKDYVPRAAAGPRQKETVFTYQGVEVPASKLSQHMRIELLDPKWKEQREIAEQKNKESNLAAGLPFLSKKNIRRKDSKHGVFPFSHPFRRTRWQKSSELGQVPYGYLRFCGSRHWQEGRRGGRKDQDHEGGQCVGWAYVLHYCLCQSVRHY